MDEQIFHDTLRRIRWSINRDDLARATEATLRMMLRRPDDQKLLESLLTRLRLIIAQPRPSLESGESAAVRQAAVRCVALLQSAKQGRLSRGAAQQMRRRRRQRQALAVGATALLLAAVLTRL